MRITFPPYDTAQAVTELRALQCPVERFPGGAAERGWARMDCGHNHDADLQRIATERAASGWLAVAE